MSFSSILKRALSTACYGFCALTLFYSVLMLGKHDIEANMSVITVLLFYPLCFTISFVNELLRKGSVNGFLCGLIRYATFLVSFGLFICLPHRESLTSTSLLLLFFIVTILYVLGSLLYAWLAPTKKKKEDRASEYVNVYKTANKK